MRRRLIAAALLTSLLAAACGDDQDPALDTAPPTATDETSDGAGPATTASPPDLAGTAEVSVERPGATALLSAVRVAGHEGFDRLVFEFEQRVPGYQVRYVEPPIREDGSGEEVAVGGQAFVEVRMEPASGADLSGAEFRQAYAGPARIQAGDAQAVVEVVRAGDFEAVLTWVVGLRSRTGFRVDVLDDPARLVIEFVSRS